MVGHKKELNKILGLAEGNILNLAFTIALYAIVHTELENGLTLPGLKVVHTRLSCLTSSKLHAQLRNCVTFECCAGNQAFQGANNENGSWRNLWRKVAPETKFSLHEAKTTVDMSRLKICETLTTKRTQQLSRAKVKRTWLSASV